MTTTLKSNHINNTPDRKELLKNWLNTISGYTFTSIQPASADASFRRYFRTTDENSGKTYVIMDAPPEKEDCTPFIKITKILRDARINAPEILEQNIKQGFLLLADLGDQPYLNHLNNKQAETLYTDAISALIRMQNIKNDVIADLPAYDERLLRDEMQLFEDWYLNQHLEVNLDKKQKTSLDDIFNLLIQNALEQPQVFVHRDYHSRNLMLTHKDNPGVIDYQDAVIGPCTYDLVSLFKDCYVEWPRQKIEQWLYDYFLKSNIGKDKDLDFVQFIRWFDLMGVQRHLKVLGIFSRLNYRDGKEQYLNDLPLTLKYIMDACENYDELTPLKNLLNQAVLNHKKVAQL